MVKDVFETNCVSSSDCGIVDHDGCVDNILHSTVLRVDTARSKFQSREVTNINLSISALASCTRRKTRKFLDELMSGLVENGTMRENLMLTYFKVQFRPSPKENHLVATGSHQCDYQCTPNATHAKNDSSARDRPGSCDFVDSHQSKDNSRKSLIS